jgi:Rrf2 family iron-sulfur cluster assembly transcriptional regulator
MLALARLGKNGDLVSISTLSEDEAISSVFLEQIFFKLKKAGIVRSVRGPGGGFSIARPLDSLNVKEILDAAGEDLSATTCDKRNDGCERFGHCASHQVWETIANMVNEYLRGLTLRALLQTEVSKNKAT